MPRVLSMLSRYAALLAMVSASGCANLMTARAIQTFADGVATGNLELVKANSSSEFDEKALRKAEALDDFDILHLPKGKVSVAGIEDISPNEKKVTVEVGENKKRVLYKLTRQPGSKKWLVDDIYLKQRKPGEEEEITKSVTETMDLLLTVREFLDNWETGEREDVLAITTPELADLLSDLSPVHLQQLTAQVVGSSKRGPYRPEARIEDDRAVVILERGAGQLLIELTLSDGTWRVNDVAVDTHDKTTQVRSTRRMAYILRATNRFLSAYEQSDLPGLEEVCNETFYRNSLAVADLTSVDLPTMRLSASPYTVRVHEKSADVMLETPGGTYMLTMMEREPGSLREKVGKYEVSEVTIYNGDDTQVKRLSALFTAQSILELFNQALIARDLPNLKQASTSDFNRRVWDLVDVELLNTLPMEEIEPVAPKVVATVFQGAVTEITVTQGTRALTYVLRDSNGRMVVDDVLLPVVNRPNSLKQNLRAMIPVYGMARAFFGDDVEAAVTYSSPSLTKHVWQPLAAVPQLGVDAVNHLTAPITSLTMTEDRADLVLGDDTFGTRLTLTRVGDRFVVEDATFVAGPELSQHIELRRAGQLKLTAGQ